MSKATSDGWSEAKSKALNRLPTYLTTFLSSLRSSQELNEDRAKVMKKEDQRRAKEKAKMFGKKGAKKGGGGGHSDRDTAANLKAIEAGLKASIKKAWKNRASAEVKEELCVALLRRKRQEFRDGLATFEERQREREMKNVREIVVDDARELFETGELPIQVRGGEELRLERSDISVSPSTITNNLPLIAASCKCRNRNESHWGRLRVQVRYIFRRPLSLVGRGWYRGDEGSCAEWR